MPNNWEILSSSNIPRYLILHGGADNEVPLNLAKFWKEKLHKAKVSVIIAKGKNHMLGDGEQDGAALIAGYINEWWPQSAIAPAQ